jgi:hypothetical protein
VVTGHEVIRGVYSYGCEGRDYGTAVADGPFIQPPDNAERRKQNNSMKPRFQIFTAARMKISVLGFHVKKQATNHLSYGMVDRPIRG